MANLMFPEPLYPADEIPETTELLIRLTVNTDTYGDLETIMREVEESLEWMAYEHDAILGGMWDTMEGEQS